MEFIHKRQNQDTNKLRKTDVYTGREVKKGKLHIIITIHLHSDNVTVKLKIKFQIADYLQSL